MLISAILLPLNCKKIRKYSAFQTFWFKTVFSCLVVTYFTNNSRIQFSRLFCFVCYLSQYWWEKEQTERRSRLKWAVTFNRPQTACLQPGGVLATGKWPHPSVFQNANRSEPQEANFFSSWNISFFYTVLVINQLHRATMLQLLQAFENFKKYPPDDGSFCNILPRDVVMHALNPKPSQHRSRAQENQAGEQVSELLVHCQHGG